MSKEKYRQNRERVFTIYGIDPSDPNFNCHHVHHRAHGGSNEKENLIPTPKRLHELFHREGTDRQAIHDFCDEEYGGDPYKG